MIARCGIRIIPHACVFGVQRLAMRAHFLFSAFAPASEQHEIIPAHYLKDVNGYRTFGIPIRR
jgi:hypothetical protein